MITFLCIILAAIFKAVADTLDDHFDTSIFWKKNPLVWDANHSTVKKWWITNYKPDPWHLSNSAMILCYFFAIAFNDLPWPWWLQFVTLGFVYNSVFEVFYSKFLLRKRK